VLGSSQRAVGAGAWLTDLPTVLYLYILYP